MLQGCMLPLMPSCMPLQTLVLLYGLSVGFGQQGVTCISMADYTPPVSLPGKQEPVAEKKRTMYTYLETSHHFVPVAAQSLWVFGPETLSFSEAWESAVKTPSWSICPTICKGLLWQCSMAAQLPF